MVRHVKATLTYYIDFYCSSYTNYFLKSLLCAKSPQVGVTLHNIFALTLQDTYAKLIKGKSYLQHSKPMYNTVRFICGLLRDFTLSINMLHNLYINDLLWFLNSRLT